MGGKISRIIKRTFIVYLTIMLLLAKSTISFSSEEEQNVTFAFKATPKIDVILSKQRTSTDITNFEEDLLKAIEAKEINTKLVRISSVQAETIDIAESFTWERNISSSIGSITISPNGKDVTMVGNRTNPGKNAIWIIPGESQEQEFNFGYNIDYGDSFNAAGMLLRVQRNGNVLTGYMLSFNNTSGANWYSAAGSCNGAIWEFSYTIGANSTNMTKTLKQGLTIAKQGTLNVKVDDNQIVVTGGGMSSPVTYILENSYGNGYGFFSDHYSHNCDRIGSFALTGINLEATTVRKFVEVLREPEWRNDALKVLVNVSDVINEELDTEAGQGELSTRLLNEDINYVAWGKDVNQAQYDKLIVSNNGNGKFINNISYEDSIEQTAQYIKELVDKLEPKSDYLLLNEPVSITSEPSDILKNTIDEEWPYGKWKIIHDHTYYENDLGQFAMTNKYMSDMIEEFDKTGKYTITYQDKTISPKEIYVHRKPVAVIGMIRNGMEVAFTSNSYDLDLYSRDDKGIKEEEWRYKKTIEEHWNDGKLTALEENAVYLVQLRVKDYQNTWSNVASLYVTTESNNEVLPIASFELKNGEITKYEELEVTDTSYDPAGKDIIEWKWEVFREGESTSIYTGTVPLTKYETAGIYTMKLIVKNSSQAISEAYARKFTVVEDTIPPEVIATPVSCAWKTSETVSVRFRDQGASGFKSYKYAITDSQERPTSWSEEIATEEDTIEIEQEGRKYLHIIATDNAGNTSEDRIYGEYLIDRSTPEISIDIDLQNIKINELIGNISGEDNYSGLKSIKVNGIEVTNKAARFTKNGTYLITAEDNVGNIEEQNIIISNIYYECEAGLNHPIYSSTYDKCPICDEIDIKLPDIGGEVPDNPDDPSSPSNPEDGKNQKVIYDGETHRVVYENLTGAQIVEYYNGTKDLPKNAGEYEYELKTVYEGKEYETGIKGKYTIIPRELTIEGITAIAKNYDKTNIIEITGGEILNAVEGDDITVVIPETGNAESEKIGTWKVNIENIKITGSDAKNYIMKQPEYGSITVEIAKPKEPLMKLNANVFSINGKEIKEDTKMQDVIHNDIAKIRLSIVNKGDGNGYISKIKTKLPEGIELLENSEINNKYKWNKNDKNEIETTNYSMENNSEGEIGVSSDNTGNSINELVLDIEVQINNVEKRDEKLLLEFEIEQQDINGDIVEYNEENVTNSKDEVGLSKKYFDASIKNQIKTVKIITNGIEKIYNVEDENDLVKLEIPEKELEKTKLKVEYEITITNEGSVIGEVQKLINALPKGLKFVKEENADWEMQGEDKAVYNKQVTLKEKETKRIKLVLNWDLGNNNIGGKKNIVEFEAKDDIDEVLIKLEKISIETTNNLSNVEMIVAVKTGENVISIAITVTMSLSIFAIGIYLIKRYVI